MRFAISVLAVLLAVSAFEACQGENIFKKLGSDLVGYGTRYNF